VHRAGHLPLALSDLAAATSGPALAIAGGRTAPAAQSGVGELRLATISATASAPASGTSAAALPGDLIVADRGNNRILLVNPEHQVIWQFPTAADLAAGRRLRFNDDTFVAPGGRTLVANEEDAHVIVSINIATRALQIIYGHRDVKGSGPGFLNTPDDAYPLPDGSVVVADAYNCRVIWIKAHRIVRQIGQAGVCAHDPPRTLGAVNGDTPLPDGGVLVSEIPGHWVDEFGPTGKLRFAIQAPVSYPSDPQPLPGGRILLADYARPGRVLIIDDHGRILWRYAVTSGEGMLDHPSLALALPNGNIAVNDDYRHRVVVIDPRVGRIVWQYGVTDHAGARAGHLDTPDGMDFVPTGLAAMPLFAAVAHP
jgi:hypothetical protein